MRKSTLIAAALALALPTAVLAQQAIKIAGLVELSGTGATAGTNFDNGVKLAVKEINAAGGILGRKVEYTSYDTQTQPGYRQGARAEGGRRERLRRHGPGVLGLDHREHGRDAPREHPELHRRRGRGDHPAGQSAHLPHVVHAVDGDAEGREVHQERREGEERGADLGEQRLRQGRARFDHEGARSGGRQGRGRHFDRSGPGRLLRCRAARQAEQRRRGVHVHERGRVGARAARTAQAGLRQADHRRDDAHGPEGDRARGRRRERRGRARRPHGRTRPSRRSRRSTTSSRRNTSTRATTTA